MASLNLAGFVDIVYQHCLKMSIMTSKLSLQLPSLIDKKGQSTYK